MIVLVFLVLSCVSTAQFEDNRLHRMIFGPHRLENTFADPSCNVTNWSSLPGSIPASCLYYVEDPEAEYNYLVRPKRNTTESLGIGSVIVTSLSNNF